MTSWTKEEIRTKIDWEGGTSECIVGYGLTADVLPANTPAKVVRAWRNIEASRYDLDIIGDWLWGEDE